MAGLSRLQRDTIREILRQLRAARSRILAAIVDAPNDAAWGRLAWQRAEITRAIRAFQSLATATTTDAARKAFELGIASIERPFANAGVALPPLAPRIDHRVLLAMEDFLTDRISDISTAAVNKINTALAQHILGVDSISETITKVQQILGGESRRSAMTIVYTDIGRAHSSAQYQAMLAQARYVPGLKKRWRRSAKQHPRPSHVAAAHEDPIPVAEPFEIVSEKTGEVELLRFPRDPRASIRNTINCGCSMIPVLPSVDEIFDGDIGPIVQPGTVVQDGVPVAGGAAGAAGSGGSAGAGGAGAATGEAGAGGAGGAGGGSANGGGSWADDIFAGPIGPIVQPGTVIRDGVVVAGGDGPPGRPPVPGGGAALPEDPRYSGLPDGTAATLARIEPELAQIRQGELSYVVDMAGLVVLGRRSQGDAIEFFADEVGLLRGSVLTHSHPNETTFSIHDIVNAARWDLAEIRVVTATNLYRLRPPPGGWPVDVPHLINGREPPGSVLLYELQRHMHQFTTRYPAAGRAEQERAASRWLVLRLQQMYGLDYQRHRQ